MDWFEDAAHYLVRKLGKRKFVVGDTFLREYLEKETSVLDGMDDEEKDISINEWVESFETYLYDNFSNSVYVGKNFRWMKESDKPTKSKTFSTSEPVTDNDIVQDIGDEKPRLEVSQSVQPLEVLHQLFESDDFAKCIEQGYERLEALRKEAAPADEKLSVLSIMIDAAIASKRIDLYKLYSKQAEILAKDKQHEDAAKSYEKAVNSLIKHHENNFSAIPKVEEKINELFRKCRVQFENGLAVGEASRVFVRECRFKKSIEKRYLKKALMFVFDITSDYGECPKKVFYSGVAIIFLWAFFYLLAGINGPSSELLLSCSQNHPTLALNCVEVTESVEIGISGPAPWSNFPSHLYYSVVTFTTLGYGDFSPQAGPSRFLSAVEAVLGLIFTSLFLATVIKKYAR